MGEWLRTEPRCHLAETVAQHRHCVVVVKVLRNVTIHRLALYPVHQKDRELIVIAVTIHKKFLFQILYGRDIGGIHRFQLVSDLAIGLRPPLLLLGEAFERIFLPRAPILHLEYHSECPTAPHRLTVVIKHRLQMRQLVKVARRVLHRTDIFRY